MPVHQLMTAAPLGHYGRFAVLGRLAVGGMAEIFLARETSHAGASRLVVLKRILPHISGDPEFVEMFFHEARLAMRLTHPNVCAIYEFGEHRKTHFIAMEWVHGVSITQIHAATFEQGKQGIPVPIATRIASEVASALSAAHNLKDDDGHPLDLVHRDVTPDNIMVGFDGTVKLLDFGVAKAKDQRHRTEAGTLKGKFAYMPPEQYRAEKLDGRADVFALGTCLYEAATGFALFHRDTDYETMSAILSDNPAPRMREHAAHIDPELDAIVARALAKHPRDRFRTAAHMQRALDEYLVSRGEVVSRNELARYVRRLCPQAHRHGPSLERDAELTGLAGKPVDSDVRDLLQSTLDGDEVALASLGKRRRTRVTLALSALVLAGLGAVVYVALTGAPPP